MEWMTPMLSLNATDAVRTAMLSKCDLMTSMVSEFPELQGLMGYYYAKQSGETGPVAIALNEQYMPRFAGDSLPTTELGCAVSVADRIDTLVGAFLLGEKPSGVKDPFKLRRHALAVGRILLTHFPTLALSDLIAQAAGNFPALRNNESSQLDALPQFILERLIAFYQGEGIRADLVNAVLARQKDCLYDVERRLRALADFVTLPAAETLSAACKRVNNLLNSVKLVDLSDKSVDKSLLHEKAEINLYNALDEVVKKVREYEQTKEYSAILTLLPSLRGPVDDFFEQVMVLVEQESLKMNRLALLRQLQNMLQCVADIALLQ